MAEYKFTYNGRLHGINDYTFANRTNVYQGNKMKKGDQNRVIIQASGKLKGVKIEKPVIIHYHFFEKPNRGKLRDVDNISGFAHKVIQDALVTMEVLEDDGWKYIKGYTDLFSIDEEEPRIEVTIEEVE